MAKKLRESAYMNDLVLFRNACEERKLKFTLSQIDRLKYQYSKQQEQAKMYFAVQHLAVPTRSYSSTALRLKTENNNESNRKRSSSAVNTRPKTTPNNNKTLRSRIAAPKDSSSRLSREKLSSTLPSRIGSPSKVKVAWNNLEDRSSPCKTPVQKSCLPEINPLNKIDQRDTKNLFVTKDLKNIDDSETTPFFKKFSQFGMDPANTQKYFRDYNSLCNGKPRTTQVFLKQEKGQDINSKAKELGNKNLKILELGNNQLLQKELPNSKSLPKKLGNNETSKRDNLSRSSNFLQRRTSEVSQQKIRQIDFIRNDSIDGRGCQTRAQNKYNHDTIREDEYLSSEYIAKEPEPSPKERWQVALKSLQDMKKTRKLSEIEKKEENAFARERWKNAFKEMKTFRTSYSQLKNKEKNVGEGLTMVKFLPKSKQINYIKEAQFTNRFC